MNELNIGNLFDFILMALTRVCAVSYFILILHRMGPRIFRGVSFTAHRSWIEGLLLCVFVGGLVHFGATKETRGGGDLNGFFAPPLASDWHSDSGSDLFEPYTNAVTNLCATGIKVAETSVFLRAHWPHNLYPAPTGIEVYATPLLTNAWVNVGRASVVDSDNSAVIELPYSLLPEGGATSMFFMLGFDMDTDQDGLSDSFERIVSKTDPNLSDTDGDGMPDGWEYHNGLNPLSDLMDDEASVDADGDQLSNMEEYLFGTNPHESDTDGDGLTDVEEVGRVEELRGNNFLWFDTTGHTNVLVNSSVFDDIRMRFPIPFGLEINGVCYTNAQIDLDGLVTLINPIRQTASIGYGVHHSGGVSNYLWSAEHLTIAAYNGDLYAKPRLEDWQSSFTYGEVVTNGAEYAVVEYHNVGHYNLRNESPSSMMTFQVILPRDETNTIYVSYRFVPESIFSLNEIQTFGIQLPMTNCIPNQGIYANLPWYKYSNCFDEPLTLKYHLPTGTLPNAADWDGDELSDYEEIFIHHTDPYRADTDSDDLEDGTELMYGTDPLRFDTDGDAMPDGWEQYNGLNPLCFDAESDPDEDGLPNKWEYYNGTNPQTSDSDDDLLSDREESVWVEDDDVRVPWFSLEPIQSYCPGQNVDSQLYSCELPFLYRLSGQLFTVAIADVNGVVYFAEPSTTNSISSNNNGVNLSQPRSKSYVTIAAYWTDLYMRPSFNSSVTFGMGYVGTNRYFVIQYNRVGFWSGTSNEVSFQVSVCESEPDVVYVRYGTIIDERDGYYPVSMGCQGVKELGFDIWPCLSYYYQDSPPTIFTGMTLAYHFGRGGDPLLYDTDGDGLYDGEENVIGSNPRRMDTDGDGFMDREELEYGMNPCSTVGNDGAEGDLDGDGLVNRDERLAGTNPSLVDTDGDGLSDSKEVGVVSAESNQEWIVLDEIDGTDITGLFANCDASIVNYSLHNEMRVQGESVTNVIVDLNGAVYFPRRGCGSDISSCNGLSLDYLIYPDALVVAPYWQDLYITTNAPATKISVFETGIGTNGLFILQYENVCPYSNRYRTSVTNALSFQVVVKRGGVGEVRVIYKDLIGSEMVRQNANIGYQSLGGLWSHKFSNVQLLAASNISEGPTIFNMYGQLVNGFGLSFLPGFGTNPLGVDTDGDGILDGQEVSLGIGPLASDSDGDGLFDGWEQAHGLDPADPIGENGANGDPDNDGVPNSEEYENNTNPLNSDTDGDGINDGVEVGQGTDPTDRADALPVWWVTVDGTLGEGVPKSEIATLSIPAGRTYLVCVFVASQEYPTYTGRASEYNDVLYWDIQADENETLSKTIRVNNEDGAWDEAQERAQHAHGYHPVVLKDRAFYTAGSTELSVSVTIRASNVSDDSRPSSVIVGAFPLNVVQANMPTATGVAGTTDAETSYMRANIPTNGIAYITGQPAPPQLTAQFKGLPSWVDVVWSGSLTTERNERNTLDDRVLQTKTVLGDEVYSITESLTNEIVGGSVDLQAVVAGLKTLRYPFKIRGKNPLDARARAYIDANVDEAFRDIAWMIAKHESKSGSRVYNQFNPSGDKQELPNRGAPDGWGMCQIDRSGNRAGITYTTTAETYDWHESVAAMNTVLKEKTSMYDRFVGYYRNVYGNDPSWVEPESYMRTIQGHVVPANIWACLVLYNGVDDVPPQTVDGHKFRSPIEFVVGTSAGTGQWIFHDNSNAYGNIVITEQFQTSVE